MVTRIGFPSGRGCDSVGAKNVSELNFCATNFRYDARIVSGFAMQATRARAIPVSFRSPAASPARDWRVAFVKASGHEDPVLRRQVLVLQKPLLIYQPRYARHQTCPVLLRLYAGCPSLQMQISGEYLLERYSHTRMAAKRDAVEALATQQRPEIPNPLP
jgi:hypothetical protein